MDSLALDRPNAMPSRIRGAEKRLAGWISGYAGLPGAHDEFLNQDGKPRPHWLHFLQALAELDAAEIERVREVAVHAAPNDVRALEPRDGAHIEAAFPHQEVIALDQEEAEVAREIGLLEIGFAQGPWRQKADTWFGARCRVAQPGTERLEESSETLDIHFVVEKRQGARKHETVLERVACP